MSHSTQVVIRNVAFGAAGQLAIRVLSFAFSILIVRHLGAEAYGQYAGVLAFGAVFVFIADLGLGPYAVREVARGRDTPDGQDRASALYGNVLILRLLLSVLAATLMIATAVLTGRPLVMIGAIALGAVGLVLYGAQGAGEAVLSGMERLDLTSGAKVLCQIAFVLAGGLALWLGAGYYGLMLANLLGIGVLTGVCWRAVGSLGVRPGRAIARAWPGLLRASLPFGVVAFTLGLSYKFDSLLLNLYWGDAETGYYSAAYNLVFSATILSNAVNVALYPTLSRLTASTPESVPVICERALRYLLVLSLPIATGAWALADQIVPFLFTSAYTPAVNALQIVIWATPLMFASEFLGYVVVIRGEERRVARSVLISTSVNVCLNLLLVPRFGLIAAAAMTVTTEMVLVAQYVWLLRGLLRRFDWNRTLARPLIATAALGAVAIVLRELPLLENVALSGILYVGVLLVLRVIGAEEVRLARLSLPFGKTVGTQ